MAINGTKSNVELLSDFQDAQGFTATQRDAFSQYLLGWIVGLTPPNELRKALKRCAELAKERDKTPQPEPQRQRFAYVAVYTGPGARFGISRADEGEPGHAYRPDLGSFPTYDAAAEAADKLNTKLGHSLEVAAKIVCSTMRGKVLPKQY